MLFEPSGLKTEVPLGATILEAARRAGVYLTSICGGDGYCGKCKVVVDAGEVESPPTTLLSRQEIRENTVLACQARIRSDLTVTVPRSHALDTGRIVVDSNAHRFSELPGEDLGEGAFPFEPLVRKLYLQMSPPTMEDQVADHERLYMAIRERLDVPLMQTGYRILQQLPALLQRTEYKVTAIVAERGGVAEVVDVEPGDTSPCNYAVVVDLGTTTVVAQLVDLAAAATIDAEATYNSQMHFGDDYIRRIIYAEEHDAFEEMQRRIVHDVNDLVQTLAVRQGIELQCIASVICAGNTAMVHFLLNLDPRRIRRTPYVPSAAWIPPIRAAEAGIRIHKRGILYVLPAVGAYVGSDIVAGVLTTRLYEAPGLALFIDIGTNGEVVLGSKEWMVCASSSAGPAFEGSGIRHGMRATAGAIERATVTEGGELEFKTIGGEAPRGLCGTGLLDTLAGLLELGIIDRTGRFARVDDERLADGPDGPEFTLVPGRDGQDPIVITQADILNLIRSKAGVYAAIQILMESTGTAYDGLEAIYVAGGFGNYLDVRKAVAIGMLPDIPPERIHFVGNTSVAGAKMAIMSRRALAKAEEIAARMTYFDLMNHPKYMDAFMQANFLPHTDLTRFPSAPQGAAQAGSQESPAKA
ncbi:MAG: hypothetical protein AMK72_11205 [Planctomycetes bacterium SM23_25]|nr:MAG: hypothetical protein AMK72_11205 [Planctomycetes bacterium SM23_25]